MPTARSIADIKSALLHPATTSHFEVRIPRPTGLDAKYLDANGVRFEQDKLNLLCSEATLPGSNLVTLELTNDHTGVTERHAYRRIYDDRIDLTFYVDAENYLPIRYFETWIKFIANESRAVDSSYNTGIQDSNYFYKFKYLNEYAASGLEVTKFERSMMGSVSGNRGLPITYRFVRAYPISLSSMPVTYDSSSLLKCTVSMTYMRYYIEDTVTNSPIETPNTSPFQQVEFNSSNLTLPGLSGTGALSLNGISSSAAKSSGNDVGLF